MFVEECAKGMEITYLYHIVVESDISTLTKKV